MGIVQHKTEVQRGSGSSHPQKKVKTVKTVQARHLWVDHDDVVEEGEVRKFHQHRGPVVRHQRDGVALWDVRMGWDVKGGAEVGYRVSTGTSESSTQKTARRFASAYIKGDMS